jgi:hypothetical protein
MIISPLLRAVLFSLGLGIIAYMLYVIIMWFVALGLIGAWVFTMVAGGGAGG